MLLQRSQRVLSTVCKIKRRYKKILQVKKKGVFAREFFPSRGGKEKNGTLQTALI